MDHTFQQLYVDDNKTFYNNTAVREAKDWIYL
jgi:hypothetical protein